MATADKLNKLIETKANIKEAIKAKGVTVNDSDTFASYPSKIASISSGSKFVVPDGMKFGRSSLTEFNAEQFDTSNVFDMYSMFYQCEYLKSLDLSSWNTSNVTTMSNMFSGCREVESLNLLHFDTSNVTDMDSMFYQCVRLWDFDLSNFDTSNVTNMDYMFYGCNFSSLDLSHFDLSNVSSLSQMFAECVLLMDLKLKGLGTNIGMNSYNNNLDLSSCYNITKESALYLFENAFDRAAAGYTKSFTIRLHSNTKALLTEEEIAIATNKGFTVV